MTGGDARPVSTGMVVVFEEPARPQAVSVYVRGLRYPGEVVFAPRWEAHWSQPPPPGAMFRLVFVGTPITPARPRLADRRVAVVAPLGDPPAPREDVRREAAALRETAARYEVTSDPGLDRLRVALRARQSELDEQVWRSLAAAWAAGEALAAGGALELGPLAPVLSSGSPEAWVEALAAEVFDRTHPAPLLPPLSVRLTPERTAALFDWVARPKPGPDPAIEKIAAALGLTAPGAPGEFAPADCRLLDAIDGLLAGRVAVEGAALSASMVREGGVPPDLAAVALAAHVRSRESEVALDSPRGGMIGPRITRDSLPDLVWEPALLDSVVELRRDVSGDWDAALPYLAAVWPEARPAGEHGDPGRQAAGFMAALEECQTHAMLTIGVLERLRRAAGDGGDGLADGEALSHTLAAGSWREFHARARAAFGNAARLRQALHAEEAARETAALAVEIEESIRFLDLAEVGPDHGELALAARALRARLDPGALAADPGLWPPVRDAFERWRADFRRPYLAAHAERQAEDAELARRLERAAPQVMALEGFAMIPELGAPPPGNLPERYEELTAAIEPCPASDYEIPLTQHPFCAACRVAPGSPSSEPDVASLLFEIETALADYNHRLSAVAVMDVLEGRRQAELQTLFRLDSAADLSALSGHLNARVIEFLRRFLKDEPPGAGPTAS